MTKTTTFKVHRVNTSNGRSVVTLHQLDPQEHASLGTPNDFASEAEPPRSGEAKIQQVVTHPDALDFFQVGALLTVTFTKGEQ